MSGFNYQGGDSSKAMFYILRLLSLQNVLPLHTDPIALDHTNWRGTLNNNNLSRLPLVTSTRKKTHSLFGLVE